MITELGTPARGGLDTGVRRHADDDDLLDAALLEVEVEVGVGKSVLAPMRLDHDVARLRCELRMPFAAPRAFRKDGASVGLDRLPLSRPLCQRPSNTGARFSVHALTPSA
jgi:hypothetical protein